MTSIEIKSEPISTYQSGIKVETEHTGSSSTIKTDSKVKTETVRFSPAVPVWSAVATASAVAPSIATAVAGAPVDIEDLIVDSPLMNRWIFNLKDNMSQEEYFLRTLVANIHLFEDSDEFIRYLKSLIIKICKTYYLDIYYKHKYIYFFSRVKAVDKNMILTFHFNTLKHIVSCFEKLKFNTSFNYGNTFHKLELQKASNDLYYLCLICRLKKSNTQRLRFTCDNIHVDSCSDFICIIEPFSLVSDETQVIFYFIDESNNTFTGHFIVYISRFETDITDLFTRFYN